MIVYDRDALAGTLPIAGEDEWGDSTSSASLNIEEEVRARVIRGILDDARGNHRPQIHAKHESAGLIRAATATMPHFEVMTGVVERALIQSARTGHAVRFPPILAVSPPGQGKTFYCHALAAALDTTCVEISMPQTSDRGGLGGLSTLWRGAGLGRLAHGLLIASRTASPLFLIDEIDKPANINGDDPSDILINALEPVNAAAFRDEYLKVACDLSASLWLASANDASRLSGPLLDRLITIDIPAPDPAQSRRIVEVIANKPIREADLLGVDDEAVDALADLSPRRMRLAIEIGCAYAVSASRGILSRADVVAALAIMQRRHRRSIGFLR